MDSVALDWLLRRYADGEVAGRAGCFRGVVAGRQRQRDAVLPRLDAGMDQLAVVGADVHSVLIARAWHLVPAVVRRVVGDVERASGETDGYVSLLGKREVEVPSETVLMMRLATSIVPRPGELGCRGERPEVGEAGRYLRCRCGLRYIRQRYGYGDRVA